MIMDYKEVSIRYILKEKKKSILIAFSIILSVTLVTAIGTGIVSFSDMAMENIIKETGLYHTEFMGLNKNKIFLIKKNEKLGMVGSEMPSIKAETQDHTSISISGYDDNLMKMRSMMLLSGKMPEKDDDIVVSNKAAKLGDNIDLNIEGKDRKFKVTGIIRNLAVSESEGQEVPMAIITQKSAEQFINSDKFNAYVTVKSKYKIQNTIEKIKKSIKIPDKNVRDNDRLLEALNQSKDKSASNSMIILIFFIVLIISVSSVAVIYNAFHISVLEKVKEFGMLRSIGAAPSQLKKIVLTEAVILSLLSVPFGIAAGLLTAKLVLISVSIKSYSSFNAVKLVLSYKVIFISALLGVLSTLLSSLGPSNMAAIVSPIEAINNSTLLNKDKICKKHSPIENMLKIDGKMAYRNLKRNKSRSNATMFSMCISIVIFITFYSFMHYWSETIKYEYNGFMFSKDFNICFNNSPKNASKGNHPDFISGQDGFTEDYYNCLKKIPGVKNVYKKNMRNIFISLDSSEVTDDYKNYIKYNSNDSLFKVESKIYGYDDMQMNMCSKYLERGSIDADKMIEENGVLIVEKNLIYDEKNKNPEILKVSNLRVGDEILLDLSGKGELNKVKVMGILKEIPFDVYYPEKGIGIIAPESEYVKLTGDKCYQQFDIETDKKADKEKVASIIQKISEDIPHSYFTDNYKERERQEQQQAEVSTFLYGFVCIIYAIGVLNIINTIGTNILLRTREFGTLRAIGMSPERMKKMIRLETIFYGFIGSIYGDIIGTLLSFGVFKVMYSFKNDFMNGNLMDMKFHVPYAALFIATFFTIMISLISSIVPLKKVSSLNIADSIKSE